MTLRAIEERSLTNNSCGRGYVGFARFDTGTLSRSDEESLGRKVCTHHQVLLYTAERSVTPAKILSVSQDLMSARGKMFTLDSRLNGMFGKKCLQ